MSTLIFEVPEGSDFWPCPEGCGGGTEDAAGGPCKRCWSQIGRRCTGLDCTCTDCRREWSEYDGG